MEQTPETEVDRVLSMAKAWALAWLADEIEAGLLTGELIAQLRDFAKLEWEAATEQNEQEAQEENNASEIQD